MARWDGWEWHKDDEDNSDVDKLESKLDLLIFGLSEKLKSIEKRLEIVETNREERSKRYLRPEKEGVE